MRDTTGLLEQLRAVADADHGRVDSGEHLQHARETSDALLRPASCALRGRLLERPLHRGSKPRKVVFEHVIDRALSEHIDGALLANRTGHEDEGNLRRLARGERQRRRAVVPGQSKIGNDEIWLQLAQRFLKCGLGLDAPPGAAQARCLQLSDEELSFRGHVFQYQQAQFLLHDPYHLAGDHRRYGARLLLSCCDARNSRRCCSAPITH